MLRAFPPFVRWKLPPSYEVKFELLHTKFWQADWLQRDGSHRIRVSERKHHFLDSLVRSMAHEMIHVHMYNAGTETPGVEHNAEFERLAKQVCKSFGFDYGQF